jgi:tetratricopeptide (TPR) repeat protein
MLDGAKSQVACFIFAVCILAVVGGCQYWPGKRSSINAPAPASRTLRPDEDLQDLTRFAQAAMARGDDVAAEQAFQRAVRAYEKEEGEDEPSVAAALNDLAGFYYARELYAKAEPLVQRALGIYEKKFGEFDPNVAASLNNLANIYRNQGDFERAEPLYRRALAIQERTLSPQHPDVRRAKRNFAAMLRAAGKSDEARRLIPDSTSVDGDSVDQD